MNETIVAQLHRSLVDAMRRSRPAALHRPVTVAEIYQDLVPYKLARTEVGFEMNADYEHTLLRLLTGEGDLARIEPREVRDILRMELDSPNPDVSLFRNYAACDVWVNVGDGVPAAAGEAVAGEAEADASWEDDFLGSSTPAADAHDIQAALGAFDEADDEAEVDEPEDVTPAPSEAVAHSAPKPAARFEIAADETGEPADVVERRPRRSAVPSGEPEVIACAFCGSELPDGRMVNFCPFCGSDQSQQPCPTCGELLDPLWRFCIACGTRVRQLGDHVN